MGRLPRATRAIGLALDIASIWYYHHGPCLAPQAWPGLFCWIRRHTLWFLGGWYLTYTRRYDPCTLLLAISPFPASGLSNFITRRSTDPAPYTHPFFTATRRFLTSQHLIFSLFRSVRVLQRYRHLGGRLHERIAYRSSLPGRATDDLNRFGFEKLLC